MVLCVLCQREACGCFGLRHGTEGRMLQRELQCPRDGPTALTVKVSDLTSSVEVSNRLKKIVLYVSSGFVRSLWPDWRLKGEQVSEHHEMNIRIKRKVLATTVLHVAIFTQEWRTDFQEYAHSSNTNMRRHSIAISLKI